VEVLLYQNARTGEVRLFVAQIKTLGPDWVIVGKAVLFQTERPEGA